MATLWRAEMPHAQTDPPPTSSAAGIAIRRRQLHGENLNSADQLSDDDDVDLYVANGFSSSISSRVSRLNTTATELELSYQFSWIITRDAELRDLLTLGLEKVGEKRLEQNLRRILVLYAKDLKRSADTTLKSQTSSIFRRCTRRVAHYVVLQARQGFNSSQPDFHKVSQLVNRNNPENSEDYNDDDSGIDPESLQSSHFQSAVRFLLSDPLLTSLKSNLRRFLSPGNRGTEARSVEVISDHTKEESITLGAWISLRRGCICIITLGSILTLLSMFLGVYFTVNKSYGYSMGDAFTLAGFVFAVGTMIDCALMGIHYPHCKCWQKETAESISLLSRGDNRDSV